MVKVDSTDDHISGSHAQGLEECQDPLFVGCLPSRTNKAVTVTGQPALLGRRALHLGRDITRSLWEISAARFDHKHLTLITAGGPPFSRVIRKATGLKCGYGEDVRATASKPKHPTCNPLQRGNDADFSLPHQRKTLKYGTNPPGLVRIIGASHDTLVTRLSEFGLLRWTEANPRSRLPSPAS